LDSDVGGLLDRLHGKVPRRLHHNATVTADPGDDGGAVFVVVAPARLTFLTAPPGLAGPRLLSAFLGLPLIARGVIEVIGFDGPLQLAIHLIRQGGVAQPPAPAIAGA